LANEHTETAQWLAPEGEQQGLRRFVETVRQRFMLVALAVLVTTLAAVAYVVIADKTYKAEANLFVTPVSRNDETLTGLPLIRDSSDPTRDVETAAKLVTTFDVSTIAKRKLGTTRTARSLLRDVEAAPVAQSNIVVVTASGPTADAAQRTANAFGEAVVEDRTRKLHQQLDAEIPILRQRLRGISSGNDPTVAPLSERLTELETLRAGDDPTIRLDTRADRPDGAAWPKPALSIIAGIVAGLVLGMGAAFGAQMLDPRLRREDQLRGLYRLPVLARIPAESRAAQGEGVIAPRQLSPAGVDAYRTLRATLAGSGVNTTAVGGRPNRALARGARSVMITGASASEGKTTTAVNLAASLALAGKRVILIEADLRWPKIGESLGATARHGIASVLLENVPLADALVSTETYGENLQLLLIDRAGEWMAHQFSLPAARTLVDEAKQIADYVIIDSPPLTAAIDALPLAQMSDDVLIVVRLGKTDLNELARLAELLAHQGIKPVGFALVGVSRTRDYGYHEGTRRDGRASLLRASEDREQTPVAPG
jgi:capsular exopolysaccharide synthesis family protein